MSSAGLARTLLRASVGSAAVRVLGMSVSFLVGIQLARYLGPAGYGIYGTVMAVVAVVSVASQFGLPQLATREISVYNSVEDAGRAKGVLQYFSLAVLTVSIVFAGLGLVIVHFWLSNSLIAYVSAIAMGLLCVPVFSLTNLLSSVVRGLKHVVNSQIYDALLRPALFATLLFAMYALVDEPTATIALAMQLVAALVVLIICVLYLRQIMPSHISGVSAGKFLPEWKKSVVPMASTELLRVIGGHYPLILLGILAAPIDQIGIFRVALAMVTFIAFPATVVNLVAMPHVAQMYAAGKRIQLQKLALASAVVTFFSVFMATIFIVYFGSSLLAFVFGQEYAGAWWPLVLMCVAYLVSGLLGVAVTILNMCGKERAVTFGYATATITGIFGTLLFYESFGINAVAIAMILSELVKGLIMWKVARQSLFIETSVFGLGYLRAMSADAHSVPGVPNA